jgi:phosphoglycolate phosphatase-like HAD superfamily hydrolase
LPFVVAFDFDQTLCDTSSLKSFRDARDWRKCKELGRRLPFRSGIHSALLGLQESGSTLGIASSTPGTYLQAFLQRLDVPFEFVLDYHSVKPPVSTINEIGRRAAIKAEQLRELCRRYPDQTIVFVGDDADDAAGALRAQVPFVHACFGGSCGTIDGEHAVAADELNAAIFRAIGGDDVSRDIR